MTCYQIQKNERNLATMVGRAQLDKMKTSKDELKKAFQRHVQVQEAILVKYREKMPEETLGNGATDAERKQTATALCDNARDQKELIVLSRKGKISQSNDDGNKLRPYGYGENRVTSGMCPDDDRSIHEATTSDVESNVQSRQKSLASNEGLDSSDNEVISLPNGSISDLVDSSIKSQQEYTSNVSDTEIIMGEMNASASSFLSPQLSPRTGMAARIAERTRERQASTQLQLNQGMTSNSLPATADSDPNEETQHDVGTPSGNLNVDGLEKTKEKPTDRSQAPILEAKYRDTEELQPHNDEFQRKQPQRSVSLSDRRSFEGRIGTTGRGSRSGLLERARSARMQGVGALDCKGDPGAGSRITSIAVHTSTTTARPTLTMHGSLSTRDIGGSRSIRPWLSSVSTTEGRMYSRLTSGRSNGNGEITSGLSEERKAEIRNQLRSSLSKDSAAGTTTKFATKPGTLETARTSISKTSSRRFERLTDESDEE